MFPLRSGFFIVFPSMDTLDTLWLHDSPVSCFTRCLGSGPITLLYKTRLDYVDSSLACSWSIFSRYYSTFALPLTLTRLGTRLFVLFSGSTTEATSYPSTSLSESLLLTTIPSDVNHLGCVHPRSLRYSSLPSWHYAVWGIPHCLFRISLTLHVTKTARRCAPAPINTLFVDAARL